MKTRVQIWCFLLGLILVSPWQLSYAQEANFSIPGSTNNDEASHSAAPATTGLESDYMRTYNNADPERKANENEEQKTAQESTSSHNQSSRTTREERTQSKNQVSGIEKPSQEQKSNSKPTKTNTAKEDKDDSVLSFNLLYYMIQKFKFSDVIDQ